MMKLKKELNEIKAIEEKTNRKDLIYETNVHLISNNFKQ